MKLKFSTKHILGIVLALDVALVGAYGYAFWLLREQNLKISALNQEVDAQTATDLALSSLQKMLAEAENKVEKIDSFYIAADGVVGFIETIESLAEQSGVTIEVEGVEAQEVDKASSAFQERVTLRIEARGQWSDIYRFILLVENLPVNAKINGSNLERLDSPDPGGRHEWKGEFSVSALKLK
jgi:Tfp pilus assembly protein PilO